MACSVMCNVQEEEAIFFLSVKSAGYPEAICTVSGVVLYHSTITKTNQQ